MPKPKIYLETTVVSVLTARPTRDVVQTALQQITREWWEQRRLRYDLCIAELVLIEAARGDRDAARRRLEMLAGIPQLTALPAAEGLAQLIVTETRLPINKAADAAHIAIAATHRIDFLLTWNCAHLANPVLEPAVRRICEQAGFVCPVICTPHQMLELEP